MTKLLHIDAKDLDEWANRLPARSELPRIIYRLIHETVEVVNDLSFPAAEDTQLPGWDGRVNVPIGHQYVPSGLSRWEVKVSKKIKDEANKDYEKRTEKPDDVDPASCTFIFVTLRGWPGKKDWQEEKRAESKWKDVRAYDAEDLAAWLNFAPATHTWLSIALGRQPRGARDLEEEWLNWSEITDPPISTDLVLAGRNKSEGEIQNWLSHHTPVLSLKAETHEEAFAVFGASVLRLGPELREKVLARSVVIHERDTWDEVCGAKNKLILVSLLGDPSAVAQALRSGHRVFVPLGFADASSSMTLSVPALSREEATNALRSSGVAHDHAWRIAALARRSLKAFQRQLAISPGYRKPDWADGEDALALAPIALAGSWHAENEDDRAAVSALAEADCSDVERVLHKWSNKADPPVRLVAGVWVTTSIEDAYALLSPAMTAAVISTFEEVALEVLSPPLQLSELRNGQHERVDSVGYSWRLKKGIANTLALASCHWDKQGEPGGWRARAQRIVRAVLAPAKENWLVWDSLSGLLPLLAEAAPSEFLDVAESVLDSNDGRSALERLLGDDEDASLFVSPPHIDLLWALQRLAWSPQHLSRAALVIAGLARHERGRRRKLGNSPSSALRGVFLPWLPGTMASLEERLASLDIMRTREPDVSWDLMVTMLPENGAVGEVIVRPAWRDRAAESNNLVTYAERDRATSEVVSRMLSDAGESGRKWSDLTAKLYQLPEGLQEQVLQEMRALETRGVPEEGKAKIWHALRKQVSRHRSHSGAYWALPSQRLDELDTLLDNLEPADMVERYSWLFDHQVKLPEGYGLRHDQHEALLEERRRDAVGVILPLSGLPGLMAFAGRTAQPHFVGHALGQSGLLGSSTAEDELMGRYLASDVEAEALVAAQFAFARSHRDGGNWIKTRLESDAGRAWSAKQRAALLVCLPYNEATFKYVQQLDNLAQSAYWSIARPWMIDSPSDLEHAVHGLLGAGRSGTACRLLGDSTHQTEPGVANELIATALEGVLAASSDEAPGAYQIGRLLEFIAHAEGIDQERVAVLEWGLLPPGSEHAPTVLHEKLANGPTFFASMVAWMCGSRADENSEEPLRESLATRAYQLLQYWTGMPGSNTDGDIDGPALERWVVEARQALDKLGLQAIGDQQIGAVLSRAPVGADKAWPHESARGIIERVCSEDLETGIGIGCLNGRGEVFRSNEGGGKAERALADEYAEHAQATRKGPWPRTATLLEKLAAEYRAHAKHEDKGSDLRAEFD